MQVTDPAADELRLYTKKDVAERALRPLSSIHGDMQDPTCPLRWTHKVGRQLACDGATLRAYLDWFRRDRPRRAES